RVSTGVLIGDARRAPPSREGSTRLAPPASPPPRSVTSDRCRRADPYGAASAGATGPPAEAVTAPTGNARAPGEADVGVRSSCCEGATAAPDVSDGLPALSDDAGPANAPCSGGVVGSSPPPSGACTSVAIGGACVAVGGACVAVGGACVATSTGGSTGTP